MFVLSLIEYLFFQITLYEQPDFMGKSDTYTTEQEELKVASSVIVESGV